MSRISQLSRGSRGTGSRRKPNRSNHSSARASDTDLGPAAAKGMVKGGLTRMTRGSFWMLKEELLNVIGLA